MEDKQLKKLRALEKFYDAVRRELRNNGRSNYMKTKPINNAIDNLFEDLKNKEKDKDVSYS